MDAEKPPDPAHRPFRGWALQHDLVSLLAGGDQWSADESDGEAGESGPPGPEDAFRGQGYLREALAGDPRIGLRTRTSVVIFTVALITYVLNQASPLTIKPPDRLFWATTATLCISLAVSTVVYPRLTTRRYFAVEQVILALAGLLILFQAADTGGSNSPYLIWYVVVGYYVAYLLPPRQAVANLAWISLLCLAVPSFPGPEYGDWLEVVALLLTLWVVGGALINLRRREDALERAANFLALADPMTATANSRSLLQYLEQLGRDQSRRFALAVVDMNGLKGANAVFGQDVGDGMVVRMGRLLARSSGEHDQVARLGGDEFAVVVPDAGRSEMADWRSGFEELLRQHNSTIRGRLPQISASIGIAVHPEDGQRPDELIDRADQRMFEQKRAVISPPYELDEIGSLEAARGPRIADVGTPPKRIAAVRERLRFAALNWTVTALMALMVAVIERPSTTGWAAALCGIYGLAWGSYCELLRSRRVTARASMAIDIATLVYTPVLIWSTGGAQSPLLLTVALPVAFYAQSFPGTAALTRIGIILAGFTLGFWTAGTHQAIEITQYATIIVSVLTMLAVMRYSEGRQRAALTAIRGSARRDRLTNLPNLYALLSELEETPGLPERVQAAGTPGLLVLDIDDFRRVNSFAGHAGGDAVLRAIAKKLVAATGEHRVHRIGGDEFAVVAHGLSDTELAALETRCALAVEGEYPVGNTMIALTITSGRSRMVSDQDGQELIDRAEEMLRRNKSTRRRDRPAPPQVML